MSVPKWYFPSGEDLTPVGHNDSSIEIFLDNITTSLTREVIQNSLDAHDSNRKERAVRVVFERFEIKPGAIPNIEKISGFALPSAQSKWSENYDTNRFLNEFEETLNSESISVLKISDYNTTGLNAENYESLVVGNSYSAKNDISSAGSKGIGKAAPFAASDLRMVFYNTNSTEDGIKSAGVMNFVSFDKNLGSKKETTQARAIFKNKDLGYINEQITFTGPIRGVEEYGMDLFILGLKDYDNWKREIVHASLNNFLLSIYQGDLEIVIDDVIINSETLKAILNEINMEQLLIPQKNKIEITKNYYEVLINKETKKFYLPEHFVSEYDFIDCVEDGYLLLLDMEPSNRKVLQTRKAGMKIYERGYINSVINFTGIFQATGEDFNEFLKDLENANHDSWSVDRKRGPEKTKANKLLGDLGRWYRDKVTESYGLSTDDEVDAIGVRDLLPLDADTEGENQKDSGIVNKIKGISVKRRNYQSSAADGDKEEKELAKTLVEIGLGEGEKGGFGSPKDGEGGGDYPLNEGGVGDDAGKVDEDPYSDENVVSEKTKQISKGSINIKLLEIAASLGQYRLSGYATKDYKNVRVKIQSVGDNSAKYSLGIGNVESAINKVSLKRNQIYLENIKENDQLSVDFTINSQLRMKMDVTMHEITN